MAVSSGRGGERLRVPGAWDPQSGSGLLRVTGIRGGGRLVGAQGTGRGQTA